MADERQCEYRIHGTFLVSLLGVFDCTHTWRQHNCMLRDHKPRQQFV